MIHGESELPSGDVLAGGMYRAGRIVGDFWMHAIRVPKTPVMDAGSRSRAVTSRWYCHGGLHYKVNV